MQLSLNVSLEQALHSNEAIRLKLDNTTTDPGIIQCMKDVSENCFEQIKKQFPDAFINSFYRSPPVNKAVGGQPTSQHQKGQAIDIGRPTRQKNLELYSWAKGNLLFDQLINEYPDTNGCPAWVHISYVKPVEKNRKMHFDLK